MALETGFPVVHQFEIAGGGGDVQRGAGYRVEETTREARKEVRLRKRKLPNKQATFLTYFSCFVKFTHIAYMQYGMSQ